MATQSSTPNNATTVLNPGTGGDTMSESQPTRSDGTTPKIARVVVAGDANANALIDPMNRRFIGDEFCLPVHGRDDHMQLIELRAIRRLLMALAVHMSTLTDLEPLPDMGDAEME